ncbi:hypothetical protein P280DRAFT_75868 [Massarina eburnea CBS 473.64]|uniref:RRM domain-containing protein n=1 Tax=Massarina eburnea CBS 473.64 TaxID=1395130 RepID=A0A6A6RT02_9PLEO|nr:hypothetical protein P280DRAFT_75868 [Massarina eburnea CBS 473.64]
MPKKAKGKGVKLNIGDLTGPEQRVLRLTNIHYDTSDDDVRSLFKDYAVVDVTRDINTASGKKTVAYVMLETLDEVVRAQKDLEMAEVNGRDVRIMRAKGGFEVTDNGRFKRYDQPPVEPEAEPEFDREFFGSDCISDDSASVSMIEVNNLHQDVKLNDLRVFFSGFNVIDFRRNHNVRTGRRLTLGFVLLGSLQERVEAERTLNGSLLFGKKVSLEPARGIPVWETGFVPPTNNSSDSSSQNSEEVHDRGLRGYQSDRNLSFSADKLANNPPVGPSQDLNAYSGNEQFPVEDPIVPIEDDPLLTARPLRQPMHFKSRPPLTINASAPEYVEDDPLTARPLIFKYGSHLPNHGPSPSLDSYISSNPSGRSGVEEVSRGPAVQPSLGEASWPPLDISRPSSSQPMPTYNIARAHKVLRSWNLAGSESTNMWRNMVTEQKWYYFQAEQKAKYPGARLSDKIRRFQQ